MTATGIALGTVGLVPLQFSGTAREILTAAGRIAGLAVLSAVVAGAVAILYRWYTRDRISNPPAVLLGIATIALYLNARTALGDIMGETATLSAEVALFNVGALIVGTIGATVGVAGGDRLARTVQQTSQQVAVDDSVGRLVRTVGRVITVELPADIEDVPGYDPVDAATKMALEGTTLVFPRGLTDEALRERVDRRLREDYRVGHVDIELEADGTVTYLGVGRRAAGIGPTLPPESAAMAIRADPAHAASAGDLVQVWSKNPQQRLLNAEVRGTMGEVVTIAMDAADASKLDPESQYKLVTLPVEERADRELTELLRAAPETFGVVEIVDGSELVGMPIAALDVTVVAVHAGGPDDHVETLPSGDRRLDAGESIYIVARPDDIRRVERAANAVGGSAAEPSGTMAKRNLEPVNADTDSDESPHAENTESGVSNTPEKTEQSANATEEDVQADGSVSRVADDRDETHADSPGVAIGDEQSNDENDGSEPTVTESGNHANESDAERSGSDDETTESASSGPEPKDKTGEESDVPKDRGNEKKGEGDDNEITRASTSETGVDREEPLDEARDNEEQAVDILEEGDGEGEETIDSFDEDNGSAEDTGEGAGEGSEGAKDNGEGAGEGSEGAKDTGEGAGEGSESVEDSVDDSDEATEGVEDSVDSFNEPDGDGARADEQGHIPIDDIDVESLDDVDIEDIEIHPLKGTETSEDEKDSK